MNKLSPGIQSINPVQHTVNTDKTSRKNQQNKSIDFTLDHIDLYLYLGSFPLTTRGKGTGYQVTYACNTL